MKNNDYCRRDVVDASPSFNFNDDYFTKKSTINLTEGILSSFDGTGVLTYSLDTKSKFSIPWEPVASKTQNYISLRDLLRFQLKRI